MRECVESGGNINTQFLVVFIFLILCFNFAPKASSEEDKCRAVGDEWVWFGDHAVTSVKYVIVGLKGRKYEIGTGLSFLGKPMGKKTKSSNRTEVKAFGLGAIKIKKNDTGEPFEVCVKTVETKAITVLKKDF